MEGDRVWERNMKNALGIYGCAYCMRSWPDRVPVSFFLHIYEVSFSLFAIALYCGATNAIDIRASEFICFCICYTSRHIHSIVSWCPLLASYTNANDVDDEDDDGKGIPIYIYIYRLIRFRFSLLFGVYIRTVSHKHTHRLLYAFETRNCTLYKWFLIFFSSRKEKHNRRLVPIINPFHIKCFKWKRRTFHKSSNKSVFVCAFSNISIV